uniref:Beta-1,4-galactosyltransferase n=1 Tax=Leptobrachium leishanense TaxID=445787 RepID=A0A8C5N3P3_9ANUR
MRTCLDHFRMKRVFLSVLAVVAVALAFIYFADDTGNFALKLNASFLKIWRSSSLNEKNEEKCQIVKETVTKVSDVNICPALSPLLKGVLQLSFDPNVTLDQVKAKNPLVKNGLYQPKSCRSQQRVAIMIPFRNREEHLLYLLNHLHPFLQRQQLEYGIYVIHQTKEAKFNRAKLLNVGYLEALKQKDWDCFIFHDVDLLPENDFNLYLCDTEPKQMVIGRNTTQYKIVWKYYFGGVTALTRDQFAKVNGYSNSYWGWGGEDDDLRHRVTLHNMKVVQPFEHIAKYTMTFHKEDQGNEINANRFKLLKKTAKNWENDGLKSCTYKLISIEQNPLYINITVDVQELETQSVTSG